MSRTESIKPGLYERFWAAVVPSLIRTARRLPPRLGVGLMITAGVGQALVDSRRLRRVFCWASAHRSGLWRRSVTAGALLANRGRFLAWATGIGNSNPHVLRKSIVIEGRGRLDDALASGGVLLVAFHLGPGPVAQPLAMFGYRVVAGRAGARFSVPDPPAGWQGLPPPTIVTWTDVASRATGLHQMARALRGGSLVILTADTPYDGRVEFLMPLPGRTVAVRSGWFTLRRLTGAPTFLILQHRDGDSRVIRVHDALPHPVADVQRDREACQAYLSGALREYIAAYPEQCTTLALWLERPEELA